MVTRQRVRRSRSGRVHTAPQACAVTCSCQGALNAVAAAAARSTWASPSTARRTAAPSSTIGPPEACAASAGSTKYPALPRGSVAPRSVGHRPGRGWRASRRGAPRARSGRRAARTPPSRPRRAARAAAATPPASVPAPRWCSCTAAASSVATRPGACAAHGERADRGHRVVLVRHRGGPAGRALGDLADLGLREQRDVAGRLAERAGRHARAPPPARSPGSVRCARAGRACRGPAGTPTRRATAGPAAPSPASVPAAPPSCTAGRSRRRPSAAASRPASHPAAVSPNVIGTACWSSVRPIMRGVAVGGGQAAAASAAPSTSDRMTAQASRGDQHRRGVEHVLAGRSPVDVRRAPSSGSAARMAATSGTTGVPCAAASRPSAAGSASRPAHAAAIASRRVGRDRPRPPADASARAASTASIAASQASSDTAARTPAAGQDAVEEAVRSRRRRFHQSPWRMMSKPVSAVGRRRRR